MSGSAALDPLHVVISEPVRGSQFPVRLMYVELIDGVYAPIGLRMPAGEGPFPLVLFAYGNGGGGMAVVREFTENVSWTQEQFLARLCGRLAALPRRGRLRLRQDRPVDRRQAAAPAASQPRPARIRGRDRHRRLREDLAVRRW